MVEADPVILAWMEFGTGQSRRFLEKMPLYVERGHYPPEKLTALRRVVFIEQRCVNAYRVGSTKGLTPEDRVWLAYLYGWACVAIKRYGDDPLRFEVYAQAFQALADERDGKLAQLGLAAYGEGYQARQVDAPLRVPTKG